MYGVTERSGFELFSTFWFGEAFPYFLSRLHFPPPPSPFVASEIDDQNILHILVHICGILQIK